MLGAVIKIGLIAVATGWLINFVLYLDLNKRVYSHSPGKCSILPGIMNGSEDIELITSLGLAFFSSGVKSAAMGKEVVDSIKGRIFLMDLNKENAVPVELTIEGMEKDHDFTPHGLSSYTDGDRVTLYVVNHPHPNHQVEVFHFQKGKQTLKHVKTIKSDLFTNPNDLIAIGPDQLFITNYVYFTNEWLGIVEMFLRLPLGSLVYYDGKEVTVAERWMSGPNGVAVDATGKRLYLACVYHKSLRIYDIAQTSQKTLTLKEEIPLKTLPDNLFVEPGTGDLYVGVHPVFYQLFSYMIDIRNSYAPSLVLRIKFEADGRTTITEPFADDGRRVSGSSVAVKYKSQLIIGTVFHRAMICDIASVAHNL